MAPGAGLVGPLRGCGGLDRPVESSRCYREVADATVRTHLTRLQACLYAHVEKTRASRFCRQCDHGDYVAGLAVELDRSTVRTAPKQPRAAWTTRLGKSCHHDRTWATSKHCTPRLLCHFAHSRTCNVVLYGITPGSRTSSRRDCRRTIPGTDSRVVMATSAMRRATWCSGSPTSPRSAPEVRTCAHGHQDLSR